MVAHAPVLARQQQQSQQPGDGPYAAPTSLPIHSCSTVGVEQDADKFCPSSVQAGISQVTPAGYIAPDTLPADLAHGGSNLPTGGTDTGESARCQSGITRPEPALAAVRADASSSARKTAVRDPAGAGSVREDLAYQAEASVRRALRVPFTPTPRDLAAVALAESRCDRAGRCGPVAYDSVGGGL